MRGLCEAHYVMSLELDRPSAGCVLNSPVLFNLFSVLVEFSHHRWSLVYMLWL